MKYMGSGRADGGDVVRLDVFDDFTQGVNAFLHGIGQTVMRRANVVSHALGSGQIGAPFQANGKTVHVGPPRLRGIFVVHTAACMTHGEGRNHRRVQST